MVEELERLKKKLASAEETIANLKRIDELSGLYNHAAMAEIIRQKVDEAKRYKLPLSLIRIELNPRSTAVKSSGACDRPEVSEEAVRRVSVAIKEGIRNVDFASRQQNNNFSLLLPNTNEIGAQVTAERIKILAGDCKQGQAGNGLTISAGIASLGEESVDSFLARADRLVKKAKKQGTNQIASLSNLP